MAKRFGRPAPTFEDENADQRMVRQIRLTREGSGMDGMYDSIASIDAMHAMSAEADRKKAIYDGILHWVLMVLFWGAVLYAITQFLRNLH